jgi:hypothetical protein
VARLSAPTGAILAHLFEHGRSYPELEVGNPGKKSE